MPSRSGGQNAPPAWPRRSEPAAAVLARSAQQLRLRHNRRRAAVAVAPPEPLPARALGPSALADAQQAEALASQATLVVLPRERKRRAPRRDRILAAQVVRRRVDPDTDQTPVGAPIGARAVALKGPQRLRRAPADNANLLGRHSSLPVWPGRAPADSRTSCVRRL